MVLGEFEVDGVMRTLESIIGVKQGDLLGPKLFTFYIAAIVETWRSSSSYELCTFRSKPDYIMTGRERARLALPRTSSPWRTWCTPTTRASPSDRELTSRSRHCG